MVVSVEPSSTIKAIKITKNKKSPESISSNPYFSETINPYIPDINEAAAPAEVSN
jgi:hypothetical protein